MKGEDFLVLLGKKENHPKSRTKSDYQSDHIIKLTGKYISILIVQYHLHLRELLYVY